MNKYAHWEHERAELEVELDVTCSAARPVEAPGRPVYSSATMTGAESARRYRERQRVLQRLYATMPVRVER